MPATEQVRNITYYSFYYIENNVPKLMDYIFHVK